MKMPSIACAVVLIAAANSASAHDDPDVLKAPVGSPLIRGESLRPFENAWQMQVTKKDGASLADAGTWKDRLEILDIDGKTYGVRTQDAAFKNASGNVTATTHTVNIFERGTMAPVTRQYARHVTGKDDSSVNIAFKSGSMTIVWNNEGKTEKRKVAVPPAFDYDGGLFALLWSAFPLREGFSAKLPSYSEDERPEKVTWYTFRVTGSERIEAGQAGLRDCWIVEGDSGSGPLKYWLSAEPPYIVQLEFRQPETGATWLLKMT